MDCSGNNKLFGAGIALNKSRQVVFCCFVYFFPQVVDCSCLADEIRQRKFTFLADKLLVGLFLFFGPDNLFIFLV
jgi:hypothetical protein